LMNLLQMPQRKLFILWTELNCTCISTDSVDGLIAPYAVPMLNGDLMDIQEENRHHPKPMMMAVKVLQLRLFQWSHETILNYNVRCDLNPERCLKVQRAIDRERYSLLQNLVSREELSPDQLFKKGNEMLSASTSCQH
jgi:hypothetical protein